VSGFPCIALSVRQPWAWAIIYGGKDIENRGPVAVRKGGMKTRRIAIHAPKGMTRDEYEFSSIFMEKIGVTCPPAIELKRGGIIGSVDVTAIVTKSTSPWWMGPRGLVLANAAPCEFIPCGGQLGYFQWERNDAVQVDWPKWMTGEKPARKLAEEHEGRLFA
jgi:hypothetical protein